MTWVPQYAPLITADDTRAVSAYMESGGWITEFELSARFAREIAARVKAEHCVLAPSGTTALVLALSACGIGAGDEVIVPDLTMAATASAPLLLGAHIRFADIDAHTLCLDLDQVESMITSRTRAVIVVSMNGRAPADLPAFADRCRARGIKLIEDAAHSLGSTLGGRPLGTIGDCGIFSFSPHKIITTGQGGAVVTNDEGIAKNLRRARDFGRDVAGADHYITVGWNFKFTDLQAALGLSQLSRLPSLLEARRRIFARYRDRLADVESVVLPATDLADVAPWFVDVLVDPTKKAQLMADLKARGFGTRPIYPALHAEPAFSAPGPFPVAEAMTARGLWLPSSLDLTDETIDAVCDAIRQCTA